MTVQIPDLALAPGCFGMSMTYRSTARECCICPFASECAPRAAHNLAILRAELGIKVKPFVEKKAPVSAEPIDPTPKKVSAHIERLGRLGVDLVPALMRGENPISKERGPQFLRIACHLLLRLKAGYTREVLVQCFITKLGHTRLTALAHAKQTVQIFEKLGVAVEIDGVIQMKVNG